MEPEKKGFVEIQIKPEIIMESEKKGFVEIPLKLRNMWAFSSIRFAFLEQCKEKKQLFVEVFVDDQYNRAFACFDTISLPYSERKFSISELILHTELESYYQSLTKLEKWRLSLPADMNPYTWKQHKINFFILPKQICFSFYQDKPEIFNFVLNKLIK